MTVPFSRLQFLDVFAQYNEAMWPFALLLWIASAAAAVRTVRGACSARALMALLAVHWAWAGAVYHGAYFTAINPAAWLFATLFLMQAALFGWTAWTAGFSTGRDRRHVPAVGVVVVVYALAYPALVVAEGLSFPAMPSFGVPCPTTLFTIGVLLMLERLPARLAIIPVAWAFIGGSSAFLLGVRTDIALLAAALMIIVRIAKQRRGRRGARADGGGGAVPGRVLVAELIRGRR